VKIFGGLIFLVNCIISQDDPLVFCLLLIDVRSIGILELAVWIFIDFFAEGYFRVVILIRLISVGIF
jgi:hypothetical protein